MKGKFTCVSLLALVVWGWSASAFCAGEQLSFPNLVGKWSVVGTEIKFKNVLNPDEKPVVETINAVMTITTQKGALFAGNVMGMQKVTGTLLSDKSLVIQMSGSDNRVLITGKMINATTIQAVFNSFEEFSQVSEPSQSTGTVLVKKK